MAWPAVRLILEAMQREPDQWLETFKAINEANPVPGEVLRSVHAMTQAWIEWARTSLQDFPHACPHLTPRDRRITSPASLAGGVNWDVIQMMKQPFSSL